MARNSPAAPPPAVATRHARMSAVGRNVLEHLKVLHTYGVRGERERFVAKLASIMEPFESRTFLFELRGGDWLEMVRSEVGPVLDGILRAKGW